MEYILCDQSQRQEDVEDLIEAFRQGERKEGDLVSLKGAIHRIKDMGEFAFVNLRTPRRVLQCIWEEGTSKFAIKEFAVEDWVIVTEMCIRDRDMIKRLAFIKKWLDSLSN